MLAEATRRRRKANTVNTLNHPTEIMIGARTRMRRVAIGMTQADLAAVLGLSTGQVSDVEDGLERVDAARLLQLSQALDIPVAWFFEGLGFEAQSEFGGKRPSPNDVLREVTESNLRKLLLAHFDAIMDTSLRQNLVSIARSLADSSSKSADLARDRH